MTSREIVKMSLEFAGPPRIPYGMGGGFPRDMHSVGRKGAPNSRAKSWKKYDGYWEMIDDGLTEHDIRATHLGMVIEEAWGEADPTEMAPLHIDTALEHMRVYPDASRVIEKLSEKYILTMITNGPRDLQQLKIDRLEFKDQFKEIIISGELGHHKPSPEIFNENTKRTGTPPEETVYIGNDYRKDIVGAHNAGWKTVWVNRNNEKPEEIIPDWTIKELTELLDIF